MGRAVGERVDRTVELGSQKEQEQRKGERALMITDYSHGENNC